MYHVHIIMKLIKSNSWLLVELMSNSAASNGSVESIELFDQWL